MKVKKLIELLQKCPEDAEVWVTMEWDDHPDAENKPKGQWCDIVNECFETSPGEVMILNRYFK